MSGKWVTIEGERSHSCYLPTFIGPLGAMSTLLQPRHVGSIWQCSCSLKYEWDGGKFNGPM